MTSKYEEACSEVVFFAGTMVTFGAIPVLGYQVYDWLQTGQWLHLSIRWGLSQVGVPVPHTAWIGLQSIFDWLLDSPLSLGLFFGGLIIAWISSWAFRGIFTCRSASGESEGPTV